MSSRVNKIYSEPALRRDNAFKNVIMRRVMEIRVEKQKPKFNDLLKMFEGKDLTNPKDKEALKKKMIALYEKQDASQENSQYTTMMQYFDRIEKVYNFQLAALSKIDKRISKIQRRKQSILKAGSTLK
mmetsp:Transcript_37482/g.43075  ORF Transcript_37482/g.43075 Transcript_37482/m.43075 type:complete len:128 (-) Transcript_37482:64-447(-)